MFTSVVTGDRQYNFGLIYLNMNQKVVNLKVNQLAHINYIATHSEKKYLTADLFVPIQYVNRNNPN